METIFFPSPVKWLVKFSGVSQWRQRYVSNVRNGCQNGPKLETSPFCAPRRGAIYRLTNNVGKKFTSKQAHLRRFSMRLLISVHGRVILDCVVNGDSSTTRVSSVHKTYSYPLHRVHKVMRRYCTVARSSTGATVGTGRSINWKYRLRQRDDGRGLFSAVFRRRVSSLPFRIDARMMTKTTNRPSKSKAALIMNA